MMTREINIDKKIVYNGLRAPRIPVVQTSQALEATTSKDYVQKLLQIPNDYEIRSCKNAAKIIYKEIIEAPRRRKCMQFVDEIYNQLLFLHDYNTHTAQKKKRFPFSKVLVKLLVEYVRLEQDVLNSPKNFSIAYKEKVTHRVIYLLEIMLYNCAKPTPPGCKFPNSLLVLQLLSLVPPHDSKDNSEDIFVNKVASKLGLLNVFEDVKNGSLLDSDYGIEMGMSVAEMMCFYSIENLNEEWDSDDENYSDGNSHSRRVDLGDQGRRRALQKAKKPHKARIKPTHCMLSGTVRKKDDNINADLSGTVNSDVQIVDKPSVKDYFKESTNPPSDVKNKLFCIGGKLNGSRSTNVQLDRLGNPPCTSRASDCLKKDAAKQQPMVTAIIEISDDEEDDQRNDKRIETTNIIDLIDDDCVVCTDEEKIIEIVDSPKNDKSTDNQVNEISSSEAYDNCQSPCEVRVSKNLSPRSDTYLEITSTTSYVNYPTWSSTSQLNDNLLEPVDLISSDLVHTSNLPLKVAAYDSDNSEQCSNYDFRYQNEAPYSSEKGCSLDKDFDNREKGELPDTENQKSIEDSKGPTKEDHVRPENAKDRLLTEDVEAEDRPVGITSDDTQSKGVTAEEFVDHFAAEMQDTTDNKTKTCTMEPTDEDVLCDEHIATEEDHESNFSEEAEEFLEMPTSELLKEATISVENDISMDFDEHVSIGETIVERCTTQIINKHIKAVTIDNSASDDTAQGNVELSQIVKIDTIANSGMSTEKALISEEASHKQLDVQKIHDKTEGSPQILVEETVTKVSGDAVIKMPEEVVIEVSEEDAEMSMEEVVTSEEPIHKQLDLQKIQAKGSPQTISTEETVTKVSEEAGIKLPEEVVMEVSEEDAEISMEEVVTSEESNTCKQLDLLKIQAEESPQTISPQEPVTKVSGEAVVKIPEEVVIEVSEEAVIEVSEEDAEMSTEGVVTSKGPNTCKQFDVQKIQSETSPQTILLEETVTKVSGEVVIKVPEEAVIELSEEAVIEVSKADSEMSTEEVVTSEEPIQKQLDLQKIKAEESPQTMLPQETVTKVSGEAVIKIPEEVVIEVSKEAVIELSEEAIIEDAEMSREEVVTSEEPVHKQLHVQKIQVEGLPQTIYFEETVTKVTEEAGIKIPEETVIEAPEEAVIEVFKETSEMSTEEVVTPEEPIHKQLDLQKIQAEESPQTISPNIVLSTGKISKHTFNERIVPHSHVKIKNTKLKEPVISEGPVDQNTLMVSLGLREVKRQVSVRENDRKRKSIQRDKIEQSTLDLPEVEKCLNKVSSEIPKTLMVEKVLVVDTENPDVSDLGGDMVTEGAVGINESPKERITQEEIITKFPILQSKEIVFFPETPEKRKGDTVVARSAIDETFDSLRKSGLSFVTSETAEESERPETKTTDDRVEIRDVEEPYMNVSNYQDSVCAEIDELGTTKDPTHFFRITEQYNSLVAKKTTEKRKECMERGFVTSVTVEKVKLPSNKKKSKRNKSVSTIEKSPSNHILYDQSDIKICISPIKNDIFQQQSPQWQSVLKQSELEKVPKTDADYSKTDQSSLLDLLAEAAVKRIQHLPLPADTTKTNKQIRSRVRIPSRQSYIAKKRRPPATPTESRRKLPPRAAKRNLPYSSIEQQLREFVELEKLEKRKRGKEVPNVTPCVLDVHSEDSSDNLIIDEQNPDPCVFEEDTQPGNLVLVETNAIFEETLKRIKNPPPPILKIKEHKNKDVSQNLDKRARSKSMDVRVNTKQAKVSRNKKRVSFEDVLSAQNTPKPQTNPEILKPTRREAVNKHENTKEVRKKSKDTPKKESYPQQKSPVKVSRDIKKRNKEKQAIIPYGKIIDNNLTKENKEQFKTSRIKLPKVQVSDQKIRKIYSENRDEVSMKSPQQIAGKVKKGKDTKAQELLGIVDLSCSTSIQFDKNRTSFKNTQLEEAEVLIAKAPYITPNIVVPLVDEPLDLTAKSYSVPTDHIIEEMVVDEYLPDDVEINQNTAIEIYKSQERSRRRSVIRVDTMTEELSVNKPRNERRSIDENMPIDLQLTTNDNKQVLVDDRTAETVQVEDKHTIRRTITGGNEACNDPCGDKVNHTNELEQTSMEQVTDDTSQVENMRIEAEDPIGTDDEMVVLSPTNQQLNSTSFDNTCNESNFDNHPSSEVEISAIETEHPIGTDDEMVVLSPTNQQLNSTSFDNTCNESHFGNHHSSEVEISSIEAEDPIRTDDEMVVVSPTNKQLNSTSFDNTCNESNFDNHPSSEVEISAIEIEHPIGTDDEMVVLSPTNQQLNSTSFDNTCNESNFDNHHSSGVEISSIEAEDPIRTDDEMVVVSPTNKQLNSTSFDNTCNESNFGSHHSSEVEISSMEAEDPIGSDDEMVVLPTTTNSSISFDNTCNKSNFGNHHISTVEISSIDTEDLIDTDDEMVVFLPTNATKKQLESSTMNHNTTDINELQPETNQVDSLADNIEDASIKTKDVTNPEQKTDVNKSDSRTNAHKLDKTVANNMSTLENDADISEAIEVKPYFNGSDESRKQFVEAIEQPLMEVEKPFYESNSDNMPKGAIQIFSKDEEIDDSIAEPNTECQVNDPEESKSLLQMPESDQINQRSIEKNSSDDIKEFGTQFQACVEEVVIKIDEEAVRKIPEEAVIEISEETGLKMLEEAGLKMPKEAGLKMPEEAGLKMLEEAGLKMPKEADLKMPEEAGLQMLEEAGLKMPKEAGLKMPEEASLQMLEEAGLKKPKEAGVKMPEEAVIKLPEDAVINMPDEAGLNMVEEAVLQLPEETVTKGSGDAVIDVSEDDIKVPEEDDIEVTEEAVAKVPREAVIMLPEEVDMEVSEEADIKLNEETVTKVPEEVVIEVSEDDVLELLEQKITAKNMEEGEYVHHEEIEKMDIAENANSTTQISVEDITEPLPSVVDEHLLNNGSMETCCETNPEASVDDDHEAKEQRELDNLPKEEYCSNHTNDSRIFSTTEVAINKLPKNLDEENTAIAPEGSVDIINANRLPTGEQHEHDETMVMEPIETKVATENNGKSIKTTGEQHECDEIMLMEPMESKVASERNVQSIESTGDQYEDDEIMVKGLLQTKVASESNVQSIESITREEEDPFDESIENTDERHEHDEIMLIEPMKIKVASETNGKTNKIIGEQHEHDEIMMMVPMETNVASENSVQSMESTGEQHERDETMVMKPMETKVAFENNSKSIEHTGEQHEHDEIMVTEPMGTEVASENNGKSIESIGEQHKHDEIMVKEPIETKVASENNVQSMESTGEQQGHDEIMVLEPMGTEVASENNGKSIESTGEQHEHDEIMVKEPIETKVASENDGKLFERTCERDEHDEIVVKEPIETKVASENNVQSMESTGEQQGHDEIMVLEPMGTEVASENNGKSIESTGEQHEHDEIMVKEPIETKVASENDGKLFERTCERDEHDEIVVKEPIETKVANNGKSSEHTGEQYKHDEIMVKEPIETKVASENDGKLFERTCERDEHDEIVVKEPIETKVANNGKSSEHTGEQYKHDEIMVMEPIETKVASENNSKSFELTGGERDEHDEIVVKEPIETKVADNSKSIERTGEWDEHDENMVMEPMETKVASVNNVQSMESTGEQREHDEIMVKEPMETKVASENNGKLIKSTVEQHEHDKIMVKKPMKTKVSSESNVQSIKSITHEEEDAFDQHTSTVDVRIKPCSVILTRENFEQMYATGNLMVATEQDQIPFEIKHGHKLTDDNLHESDGDDDIRKDDSQIACGDNIKSADCLFPIKTSNEQGSITEYTNLTGNSLQVENVMTNQLNSELPKICAPLDVGVTEEVSLMEDDSIVPDVGKGLQDRTEENNTSQFPNKRKGRNIWTPLDVGVPKEASLMEDDSIVSEVSMTSKGLQDRTEENITSQFPNNRKVCNIWSPLDVGVLKEVSLKKDDSIVSEVTMTSNGLQDRTEENIITSQFPNNRTVRNIWTPLDVGLPKEVSSKKDDSIISEVYNHETTEEVLDIMFEDNTNVMDEFCPCVAEATMNTDQGCGFDGSFVSKSGSELVLKDQIVVLLKHITSKPVVPMDFDDSQIISQEHNIEDGAYSKEGDPSSKRTISTSNNLFLVENICSDTKPNSTINVCVPKPDTNLSLHKTNECSMEFELTKNVAFLQEDSKDTYVQKSCKRIVTEECSSKDVKKSALSIMPEVINTTENSNYNKTNNDLANALIDENGTYLDSHLDYQNKGVQNMQASEKYQLEDSPAASMYALEENNQISQDNVMTTTNNPLETKTIIETEVETTMLKEDYSITSEGIVNINTNFSTSAKPVDNIDATEECGTTDTISAAISTSFVKPAVTKDVLDDVLDDPTNTMEEHELFDIDIYSQVEIESATDYNSESTLPSFLENDMAIRGSLLEPDTFAVDDSEVSERLKYYISVKIADRDNSIGGPMFGPCKKNINRAQESPEMSPTRQGNQMQYNEDVDGISSFPEHTCISTLMEGNLDSGRVQSDEIVSVFQLSEQEHQYYNGFIGHQTPQMMKNSQCATESSTPFVDLDLHLQSRSDEDMLSMMEVHYLMHPNAMANQLSPIENPPAIANLKQDNDLDDTGRSNSTDETKGYLTNCSFSDLENISFQDESLINTETPNSKPLVLLNNTVEKFDKVEVKVNEFDYASTDDMFKNIKKTDSPPKPKEVFVKKEKRLMDLVEKLNQESKKPKKVRLMEDADDSLYARKKTRPLPIKHISPLQNESPPKINTPAIIATPVDEVESSSEVRNKPNKVTLPNKSPNKPLEENLSLNTNVSESVLHCKPVTSLLENDNIKITSEEKIVTTLSTLPLLTETPPKSQKRQVAKVAPFARNSIKLAPANNNAPLYDPVIPNTYDTVKRRQRNTTSKYGAECSQTKPYQSSDRGKRKTAPIDHTRQLKEKCEEEKRRQRAGSSCSPNEEYSKSKSEESDHPLLGKRKSRCRIDDSERLDKRLKKDVSYEEQSRPRSRHISEERKGYAIKMEPKNERQSDIKTSAKSRFTSEEQMGSLQEKLTFKTKGSPYNYDKKPKASPSDKVDTTSYGKNQKSGVHNKPNITYRPKRQVQSPPNDDEELSSTDKRQRRLSSPFGAAVTQNPERRLTADELFDEFRKEHVTEHKRKVDLRDGNLIEKKGANELKQWPRPLYHPKQQSYEKLNVKISQPASSREVPHYLKRDPDGVRRSFEYMHGQASHAPHHDNHQMRIGYNQASRSYHGNDKCRPSSSERFRDDRSHNYPHGNRHAPYGSPQKDGRKHDLNYHLSIYNESLKRKPNFKDNWYEELASKVVLPTAHSQLFDSSTQDRNEK